MKLLFSKGLNYIYINAGQYRVAMSDFFFRKTSYIYLGIALLINGLCWSLAIISKRSLGDSLAILHYNVIFGIDKIGSSSELYQLPLIGLILIIGNFLISVLLVRKREQAPGQLLLITAIIGNIILLIAMYLLYIINFS
ncbi:hypothetical protein IPN41_02460 [Candidatus Falkowbacteria bacterium]|nr:MAG: hypothetical protein IPN41_02460 [Candidatus Falkowbacteria bacterium]